MDKTQIQDLIKTKWDELKESRESIKKYCKSVGKGGILIIRYEDLTSKNPKFCFVKDDSSLNNGFEVLRSIGNFKELYDGYNIELHYIVYVVVNVLGTDYDQLARLNY